MQFLLNIKNYFLLAVLSLTIILAYTDENYVAPNFPLVNTTVNSLSKSYDSIWNSMSNDLNLDHQIQSVRVQKEIHKLLADQDNLYQILNAAAPYIYFIYSQTQRRNLPAELALIPVIESEFNPYDHSNKGATGLWQIMPQTGRELGIKIKSGYDGRRNVIASTKAALAYFNDLGNSFNGNWDLAIAAYNCGQVKIESAIRKTGSHSFWNLPLPRETKLYVPKLLAVAEIIKHPKKYGVLLPPILNKPYFVQLTTKKTINLKNIADSSGINIETLHTLNPDYKLNAEKNGESYSLLIPVTKIKAVQSHLKDTKIIL